LQIEPNEIKPKMSPRLN